MLQAMREVFTKEYQEGVRFLEFKKKMCPYVKLKNASESIDGKMAYLSENGYCSDCHIEVGAF